MAQDNSAPGAPKQEVDLDEIEVDILILCKNASVLNQSGAFLTRRGWPTTVLTNLSQAVEHIADKKPDIVLLSFSHTNPAVIKLPDLITTTFNLTCVGFVETLDAASTSRLNGMKLRHKIQGSPSGPNLQRSIRKILAEKYNIGGEDSNASTRPERERSSGEGSVTIKGAAGKGGADASISIKSKDGHSGVHMVKGGEGGASAEGAANRSGGIGYMPQAGQSGGEKGNGYMPDYMQANQNQNSGLQGHSSGHQTGSNLQTQASGFGATNAGYRPDAHSTESSETETVSTGKYKMSKKVRRSLKDLASQGAVHNQEASSDSAAGNLQGAQDSDQKAALLANLKKSLFGEAGAEPQGSAESDLSGASGQSGAQASASANGGSTNGSSTDGGAGASGNLAGSMSGSTAGSSSGSSHGSTVGSAAGSLGAPSATGEISGSEESLQDLPPMALLERAVDQTLRRICQKSPELETRPLGSVNRVAVFPLASESLNGYLVLGFDVALAGHDDFLIRSHEMALREEFTAMRVPAVLEAGFWVDMPELKFIEWISAKAEFQLAVPHEHCEVGAGFFAADRTLPKVEPTPEAGMHSIAIEDISTEHPINFKAYLHLKKNKKYFLYLRDGGQLHPKQKERLKSNQVNTLFMKSVDVANLRVFLATSFLRSTLKDAA